MGSELYGAVYCGASASVEVHFAVHYCISYLHFSSCILVKRYLAIKRSLILTTHSLLLLGAFTVLFALHYVLDKFFLMDILSYALFFNWVYYWPSFML